uniref:Rhomboid-related protein 2 (inferred by orthology to a C. elegans protein) n=1 Tax=Strongyloides venezuelensis TaxID=75913 RepID=A0A0K0F5P9_STRVS
MIIESDLNKEPCLSLLEKSYAVTYKVKNEKLQNNDEIICIAVDENNSSNVINNKTCNDFLSILRHNRRNFKIPTIFASIRSKYCQMKAYKDERSFCIPLFIPTIIITTGIFLTKSGKSSVYYKYLELLSASENGYSILWRLLTYSLLHIDILHWVMNSTFLLFFGLPLELEHGWKKILFIYIVGVISGGLAHLIHDPKYSLIGCSAGVFAILMFNTLNLLTNWKEVNKICRIVNISILIAITILEIYNIFYNDEYCLKIVSCSSHVGGVISAIFTGIPVLGINIFSRNSQILRWMEQLLLF